MRGKSQKNLPPMLERYELKYTIPRELIEPVSDFASVYCSPDKYSLQTESGFYRVNNLYFDSPGYLFLRRRMEGAENRFNMRIRSYGDHPEMPYFLEIKQKIGNVVRKYRAPVTDREWYKVFTEPGAGFCEKNDASAEAKNRALFERSVFSYNASPKVLTQYVRKAWVSDVDDYARVTFDMDLRFMHETGYNLVPREEKMVSCDTEALFDPGCSVILELKCYTSQVPLWMIDLIRYFDLQRRSFSKYMTGVAEVFGLHRYDAASRVAMVNL
ncbi:polyphosphate polymerase domain-containing protein [Desulfobacterales bacterium HSG2]|nr:polyphosphate polymerase domain-containing protein [Desulfobacterales bacterium HSG2]